MSVGNHRAEGFCRVKPPDKRPGSGGCVEIVELIFAVDVGSKAMR